MKISIEYLGVALTALGFFTLALAQEKTATTRTVFEDIAWHKTVSGREIVNAQGDFKTGRHLKLIQFPAGQKTAKHAHSHAYTGVVVKGQARHFEPGKPETMTVLTPGSFWFIPANVAHVSECLVGETCVFATQSNGAFDVKPID